MVLPSGEHDAGVGVSARLHQAQTRPVQRTVVSLLFAGQVLQPPVVGVGPAVVGAGEVAGVAQVGTHYAVAPVAAHVQEGVQLALAVAGENHRVFPQVGVEEVVGFRHQRLVPDHQPGAPKDLLLLLGIDVSVDEDAPVQLAGIEVDYPVFLVHNGHRIVLLEIEWCAATGF